jgi:RNA polymerase sigma-70 factor, ECF subfamily
VEAWLYQITRNAVIDHYRTRVPAHLEDDDAVGVADAPSATVRSELAHCLRPLMDRLPESYRVALELSELDGLTQQETAKHLGLSLSGAKSRVQRGRRLLQDEILACCRLEFDSRGGLMSFDRRNGCASDPDGGCGTCT